MRTCPDTLGPGIACELEEGHDGDHWCAAAGNLIDIHWSANIETEDDTP